MSKSNKYGYSGVNIPTQAFQSNKGKFDPSEINELVANDQWTQYGQLELIETKTVTSSSLITFNNIKIGKILIDQPYPFGLIKILEPNLEDFKNKILLANNKECKILEHVK